MKKGILILSLITFYCSAASVEDANDKFKVDANFYVENQSIDNFKKAMVSFGVFNGEIVKERLNDGRISNTEKGKSEAQLVALGQCKSMAEKLASAMLSQSDPTWNNKVGEAIIQSIDDCVKSYQNTL